MAAPMVIALWPGAAALAQGNGKGDGLITLEEIYSPDDDQRIDFSGSVPRITWLDDDHWLQQSGDEEDDEPLMRVEASTGKAEPFYDADKLVEALVALAGVDEEDAKSLAAGTQKMTSDRTGVLLELANDLFYYRYGADRVQRLTHDPAVEVGAEFSPDGRWVSFVRDYNLHLVEIESGRERSLTDTGSPELFLGRLDWVYQEEIYGRGNFKGYWWSPDSRYLVYLRLDEAPVREFTVVDHLPTELDTEITNYPKAGSPNPRVTLGVAPVVGGETRWIDTQQYQPIEHLIVRVDWTPQLEEGSEKQSEQIVYQVQDREQTWLDLNYADPLSGKTTRLFRETTEAFVNVTGQPHWLDDGTFLWLSERTGFQHLYHYDAEGKLLRQLTKGQWEVGTLYGVDEDEGWVYFAGRHHSPIAPHLYRVSLEGGEPTRLSKREGSHRATFNPGFSQYVDVWSDFTTPPQARLHDAEGKELRVVEENRVEELDRYRWGTVEQLQVKTRDGFEMEALLIKPPDFDPRKRYPVLQYNYGGPHSPVVRNAWGGRRFVWHQMLAQKGYVIWMCDNRSASGKGIEPTWEAYRRMGEVELGDIEDGVSWLKKQRWVDPERIGIWGWSYGGFMASYALTHSKSFKAGIAGAPVTDWRLYDSIYTERYMRMPQKNQDGYDATSVVEAAKDLHGELLLIHGTMDDNVHLQNSIQLAYELQKAGKEFEMMVYPKSRHGIRDRDLRFHLQRLMTDFILRKL